MATNQTTPPEESEWRFIGDVTIPGSQDKLRVYCMQWQEFEQDPKTTRIRYIPVKKRIWYIYYFSGSLVQWVIHDPSALAICIEAAKRASQRTGVSLNILNQRLKEVMRQL